MFSFLTKSNNSLRSRTDNLFLKIPKINSKKYEQTISFAGPKILNGLPLEIRSCTTDQTFKNKLKTYLFSLWSVYTNLESKSPFLLLCFGFCFLCEAPRANLFWRALYKNLLLLYYYIIILLYYYYIIILLYYYIIILLYYYYYYIIILLLFKLFIYFLYY